MKILFINPPIKYSVKLRGPFRTVFQHDLAPPLGIMALSSYIKLHGYNQVKLINGLTPQGLSDAKIIETVKSYRPDVVGISVNTFLYYNSTRIAKMIKDILPEVKIVFGGPHLAIYGKETVMQPMVDFGVVGEGEYTFLELLQQLEGQGDFGSIAGLVWKRGEEVVVNPAREFNEPLDALPIPDHSILDGKYYRIQYDDVGPAGIMVSSRGCPFHCTFCSPYPYFRMRSAASVVDEMFELKRLGYRAIRLSDDTFNANQQRVLDICELMRKRGFDLPWSFNARVNTFNEEQAQAVAAAGCTRINFGVESAVQEMLDSIKKGITLEQVREAFRLCKKYHIITVGYFLIGLPGETKEQAQKTIDLAFEIAPDYPIFNTLTPNWGSQIYHDAVAAGAFNDYMLEFAKNPAPELYLKIWESGMAEKEVFNLMRQFILRYYFRPTYILKTMRRIGSFENFITKSITAARVLARLT